MATGVDMEEPKGLGGYIRAAHGGLGGLLRDAMVAVAAWVPGLLGIGVRAVWDRLWISGSGRFAAERDVRILGCGHITIEDGVYLDRGVYLHGRPGGLSIGAGSRLMQGAVIHVYNFRGLADSGIRIGQRCVIGINAVITGQGLVEIGDDVIIGPGAMILPVDHNRGDADRPIRLQGITARGIRVGPGAWIGAGAIILAGVEIGENAVVGAGSVVTRDVAAGAVVAGNPARAVKDSGDGGG